jgi:hypothetical protein
MLAEQVRGWSSGQRGKNDTLGDYFAKKCKKFVLEVIFLRKAFASNPGYFFFSAARLRRNSAVARL